MALKVLRIFALCISLGLPLAGFVSGTLLALYGNGLGAVLIGATLGYWLLTIWNDKRR